MAPERNNRKNSTTTLGGKSRTYEEILAENERLKGTNQDLKREKKELEDESVKLKAEIRDLNDDVINSLAAERDEQVEAKFQYMDKLEAAQKRIHELEEEQSRSKGVLNTLTLADATKHDCSDTTRSEEPVTEPKEERDKGDVLSKVVTEVKTIPKNENLATTPESLPVPCDSGIGMDINPFKEYIDDKIESLIDDKLNKRLGDVKPVEENHKTSVTGQKSVDVWNKRECNLIIHGLEETGSKTTDEKKVTDLINAVNDQCAPTIMYRLGVKAMNKSRPIMVHLRSEEEKDDILSKLWRLKYTRSTNEKISITHDYTVEERGLIREMVDEAKRRNLSGNIDGKQDFLWKVRGTPKTKMQIVKIRINRS